MDLRLDSEWKIRPIKGDTGKTYLGLKAEEKVFIKRNTTPMLAALSKEGITPKLVWTKRTGNGDVLSAQEWLEGRILSPEEIGARNDVIDVLYHLHHSYSLKNMLEKMGGQTYTPQKMLQEYMTDLPKMLEDNQFLALVQNYLANHIPHFQIKDKAVIHGDVNCRNWLVCNHYLYLVDWDSVMFGDPFVDIGSILGHYVPTSNWGQWLISYGIHPDSETLEKTYWYALLSMLQEIKKYYSKGQFQKMNQEILQLKRIYV
ncbi:MULTISPECIES: phosphotransferase family protein [Enterococcus]|uniref:Protein kinase n=1 Tax=Enterococcus alcedinis TaxID=1274384 RepID=A0A917JG47_9ENTE|nr:phosphotransferase family protein [Enterococcus alcedinis]MBP2102556.1 thiamine kinase-like enzyme [Enterococcus alcedinis]GGI66114.1 protein kinase [Enterococcus alcedinis]